MKKILKKLSAVLLVGAVIFGLVACGTDGKINNAYEEVVSSINSGLLIPNSMIVYSAEAVYVEESSECHISINYTAQNRMGGYASPRTEYYTVKDGNVSVSSSVMFKLCKSLAQNGEGYVYKQIK